MPGTHPNDRPDAARASDAVAEHEDGPTRASTLLALLVTVVPAAVLATRVGPTRSAALAGTGAALFACSLWLVGRERWRTVALAAAGFLALFVGVTFTVAVGFAALGLVGSLFPATDAAQVPERGLAVVAGTLAVAGAAVAMVGGATTVGNVLRADTAKAHATLSVKTFLVPFAAAAVALLSRLLGRAEGTALVEAYTAVVDSAAGAFAALVAPTPGRTHLLTLCVLLVATGALASRALGALPLSELLEDRTDASHDRAVRRVRVWLRRLTAVALLALPVVLLELALSQPAIESLLGSAAYGAIASVSGSHLLRSLLLVALAFAATVLAGTWALRRAARADPVDVVVAVTPFVGGVAVVGIVLAVHEPALATTVAFVAERLPEPFAGVFREHVAAVVDYYGSAAVALGAASVLVGMTALLSALLALIIATGYLPDRVAAPALASAGLFAAAAFAAPAGVAPPFVVAGVVASVLAWDAGEYGVTLGREIGRAADTRGTELVHASGTLAVGVACALATAGLYAAATAAPVASLPTVPFALVGALMGLVVLLAALR